ncbi:hypothetical protein BDN67DRAFT_117229 [Paxillus ammoniavirescens]|nr:hypothetical protein BDN67DRAFT_117229 [Paxillus ammoniavirescens]
MESGRFQVKGNLIVFLVIVCNTCCASDGIPRPTIHPCNTRHPYVLRFGHTLQVLNTQRLSRSPIPAVPQAIASGDNFCVPLGSTQPPSLMADVYTTSPVDLKNEVTNKPCRY